jgi:hypothetical protein
VTNDAMIDYGPNGAHMNDQAAAALAKARYAVIGPEAAS